MNFDNITINGIELSSNLAEEDTYNYFSETLHQEHLVYDSNGDTRYTDEAQEYFNARYDYYLDKINNCAIKRQ